MDTQVKGKILYERSLQYKNPWLAKQWHPVKNGQLTPENVSYGSGKKVWWICDKGHEWEAKISNRYHGNGCPYCSGYKATEANNLFTLYPKLAKEINLEKSADINVKEIGVYSSREVIWWICSKGHEWKDSAYNRTRLGSGCPYCSGHRVCTDNCLETANPVVAKEWHPEKNKTLTAKDVTANSNKIVWWKCGKGHEWRTKISHRNNGMGCPYCGNKKVCEDNCLENEVPEIVSQWHPTKNGKLTPKDVISGSGEKVWWICKKGHEWQAAIASRKNRNHGCPYCSNHRVCEDNNLAKVNPGLIKEWHPDKNGKLTPAKVLPGSITKIWWLCNKGHEWKASVHSRNRGSGCPYCSNNMACEDNCLAKNYPELSKEWHYEKNKTLTPEDVTPGSEKKVWWKCKKGHEWKTTIAHRVQGNKCPYCGNKRVCEDNCLATLNPELAKEWHPEKNGRLTPFDIIATSPKKVWWKCKKGHEWKSVIYSRNKGTGCPYCKNRLACEDNCLATLNPELAKERHPEKNGILTPKDIVPGSAKKVWWKCFYGHEWQARIVTRHTRGQGCPGCYRMLRDEGFYSIANIPGVRIRSR